MTLHISVNKGELCLLIDALKHARKGRTVEGSLRDNELRALRDRLIAELFRSDTVSSLLDFTF